MESFLEWWQEKFSITEQLKTIENINKIQ